ncbi:MAG: hypothetical protein HC815_05855 [Richelia sp. RM1_1_1]|nr:hypothetical protein [Richelia sp. RM1_1_1]
MIEYINSQALEKVDTPKLPILNGHIRDGNRFHLLMQQIGLGIPVDNLLAKYPHLRKWVDAAQMYTEIPGNKQWNINLSQKFNSVYLIENYDFIVSNDDKVVAIDWTISKPQDFEDLQSSWKTQLRLFLLHENFSVECENISFIYLFVNHAASYQYCYNSNQHEQNVQKLGEIIPTPSQDQKEDKPLLKVHQDWLVGNINTHEYIERIPEVEI